MIKDISSYLSAIESINISHNTFSSTTLPWFRGQSDENWRLTPSIYRGTWDPDREREMVRDFQLRALMEVDLRPTTYIGWLFVMQHHGLPTRLLDWSENCLVALYFAVEKHDDGANGAVWIMHPWELNETRGSYGSKSVPFLNKEIDARYSFPSYTISSTGSNAEVPSLYPMALRPSYTTRRIAAQRGQFTVHGSVLDGFEKLGSPKFHRIIIPKSSKLSLLQALHKLGVSRFALFPDLDGLAQEIRLRYSRVFMR